MKNDYNRNTFCKQIDEETGITNYYLKLNGTLTEVPKDVYYVCYNSYRKIIRDNRRDELNGLMIMDDNTLIAIAPIKQHFHIDKIVYDSQLEIIKKVIESLTHIDKQIISMTLFDEMSEREIANILGLSKTTIHNHKLKILNYLKNILEKE